MIRWAPPSYYDGAPTSVLKADRYASTHLNGLHFLEGRPTQSPTPTIIMTGSANVAAQSRAASMPAFVRVINLA